MVSDLYSQPFLPLYRAPTPLVSCDTSAFYECNNNHSNSNELANVYSSPSLAPISYDFPSFYNSTSNVILEQFFGYI